MRPAPSTAPPQVRIERELSPRAVLTGVALGILLTPSNVYAGLRIGWSFNMSIIALLVGFTLWQGLAGRSKGRPVKKNARLGVFLFLRPVMLVLFRRGQQSVT